MKTKKIVTNKAGQYYPVNKEGIEISSTGNVIPKDAPVMWTSTGIGNVVIQILSSCVWSKLDYLLIDLPPSFSPVYLSLSSFFQIDGELAVSTPDLLSSWSTVQEINSAKINSVNLLGIIENQNGNECNKCGTNSVQQNPIDFVCKQFKVNKIASIPFHFGLNESISKGNSSILNQSNSVFSKEFGKIAQLILKEIPSSEPIIPCLIPEEIPPKPE